MPTNPEDVATTERQVSLFRNGGIQPVRISREFELEGTEVVMRKEADRLILFPIRKNRLLELLKGAEKAASEDRDFGHPGGLGAPAGHERAAIRYSTRCTQ